MRVVVMLIISGVLLTSCNNSSPDVESKIDALFKPWDKTTTAGAAVAVIKDGTIVFSKGYGMAQVEYDIPITPSSIFHIASESKQYTDFCIVLLAQQGKLSLDDDIRKYLPEVPDFGKTITIRNLIYHTSGLRDQWQLLAISGTGLEDVIHQEHVMKLVSQQKELNFDPGSRSLYCNTGYTLLAEIVKKASGKSLRAFADSAIFKPLGMTNTHFHDDYTEVVKNRTYSYYSKENGQMANSVLSYSTVGATSLFTTVEDEAKWLNNYETAQVGGRAAIDQMYEQCVLSSGRKIDYAFGININSYKGWKRIDHGGGDAGYRTYTVRFPEEKLGIVVFSNLAEFDPGQKANEIADLYLKDKSEKKDSVAKAEVDPTIFASYIGSYAFEEGRTCTVFTDSGKYYAKFRNQLELTPVNDSTFTVWDGYATLMFPKPVNGKTKSFVLRLPGDENLFNRYEQVPLSEADRKSYIGTYASDELDTRYQVVEVNDQLVLRHNKYDDAVLTSITNKQFSCPRWWMDNLIFTRDQKGNVTGFEVNSGRVLHLKFRKV